MIQDSQECSTALFPVHIQGCTGCVLRPASLEGYKKAAPAMLETLLSKSCGKEGVGAGKVWVDLMGKAGVGFHWL